jgi:hypothetical protein
MNKYRQANIMINKTIAPKKNRKSATSIKPV